MLIDDKLSFDKHINDKVNKANKLVGMLNRSFEYVDNITFKLLFTGMIRPHLEYANSVWIRIRRKIL